MLAQILFYIFATILVASALEVIIVRNPVYSALGLVMCFVTSAVLWLLIGAEFLAIVLVLVYVGAVMVLFLFVVMMLDVNLEELRRGFTRFAWLGWLTAAAIIAEIIGVVVSHAFGVDVTRAPLPQPASYSNTTALGQVLYTRFAYPFELAGVVLLIAIVAAITLTMRRRPGYKLQDVSRQVAARPQDRVRIVRMRPETAASDSAAADSADAQSPDAPSAAPDKRPLEAELEKRT